MPDCIERTTLTIEKPTIGTLDLTADQRAKALKAVKRVARRLKFRTFFVCLRLRIEIFALQVRGAALQVLCKIIGYLLNAARKVHPRIIPDQDASANTP